MNLPDDVRRALEERIGDVRGVQPLTGMSGRTVALVRGEEGILVAKGPVLPVEASFAATAAPRLALRGVRTPETEIVGTVDGQWLLMEHIAEELPRERWGADPDVVGFLRSLHSTPTAIIAAIDGRFRPSWSPELTASAVARLEAPIELARKLRSLSSQCQYLFAPLSVVSADPNPKNWRVDRDGAVALIDWERVTVAHPAIDLGILMPGLGNRETADRLSATYRDGRIRGVDILRAKAWSLVELAGTAAPGTEAAMLVRRMRTHIARWLSDTEF